MADIAIDLGTANTLAYARGRFGLTDYDRMARQRHLLPQRLGVATQAAGDHRYHDRISLVQISSPEENVLIDPLELDVLGLHLLHQRLPHRLDACAHRADLLFPEIAQRRIGNLTPPTSRTNNGICCVRSCPRRTP